MRFGVFSRGGQAPRVGVAAGEHVLDIAALATAEQREWSSLLSARSLNLLLGAGRAVWDAVTEWVGERLAAPARLEAHLVPLEDVRLQLPVDVGDYVDFYSSPHHAENVGRIFRPEREPLPASWRHLPAGYHGRAGTIVVSGSPIVRPCGQRVLPGDTGPSFGPSRRLDVEAEVAFVIGAASRLGRPVPGAAFAEHVFGLCLLNDWSARDIQAWESVPLGPFLGKSFATSLAPWVVPLSALAAARVAPPSQDPPPLPYLRDAEPWGLDLALEIVCNGTVVSRPPFATMYWTPAQQLAHLTSNGASVRTGDLYASGTVSGPRREQRGSLLELSWNGREPFSLSDGSRRTFLEDGDEVVIRGSAPGPDGGRVDLGAVRGTIVPARC